MTEVVVTGLGILLPGCDSRETFWTQIQHGDSQLRMEDDPSGGPARCAVGRIGDFDPMRYLPELPERFVASYPREIQLYLASVYQARADAGLVWSSLDLERVGLFDGVARPTLGFWYDRIRTEAERGPPRESYGRRDLMVAIPGQTVGLAAATLKVRGPTYTFTSACSSGAVAIGHALREIQAGELDVALATGHEASLVAPLFAMYQDAGLISIEQEDARRALAPYVTHSTNAFGEGAVTLVLESRAHAERRGAPILATLGGYSYGNNGLHPTDVDILGVRPTEVLSRLLRRTETAPEDIAFVVGHGNGVRRSDLSEENYMRQVFGARAAEVPLVSIKPIYGHNLGASSAMSAAAAILMVQHDFVVPTINVDPDAQRRVSQHQARVGAARPCGAGLVMSYGMGGQNAALLVKKAPETAARRLAC